MAKLRLSVDRWIGRGANLASLWPLVPFGIVGVVTYYLAQGVAWLSQFGAFGWWMAGITAFLMSALALFLLAKVREKFAVATATRKWAREVDNVNPLAPEYVRQQIRIQDIAHPVGSYIKNKRFTECMLIGKANLLVTGKSLLSRCDFVNCDVAIINSDEPIPIHNCIVVDSCEIIGGEIINCTIYVNQNSFDENMAPIGAVPITYRKQQQ